MLFAFLRSIVVGGRCEEGACFELNARFFMNFSTCCVVHRLVRFECAAWKRPQACAWSIRCAKRCKERKPVRLDQSVDHRNRDLDGLVGWWWSVSIGAFCIQVASPLPEVT
jgi:hypothetical protein